ncbi:hypothetical protein WOLCODRAFT_116386 [Wolfiporia cocos MD-104 SS10]|uniref:Uncharacterized protein n=1 Tax=Wolfiporia cocos (strain MD-104) TaxID=742152 RepID=A0A2H3JDH2_WOLCO|nr:hypothetical protein WOLCODRAFT_116386 [Wolfiporia cocos MD-104 SS10]
MPIPKSLAHRARISALVSSLKPTRLRTSVFDLLAHRIPTLWTLYRGLLRNAPTERIRWRIQVMFRREKSMRKAIDVRVTLVRYHRWLEFFVAAKKGDAHKQAVLQRYSQMLIAKEKKQKMKEMLIEAFEWQRKLATRPILTGSYLRPTLYNGPLPQMRPLPLHIAGLIHSRRKRREKRMTEFLELNKLKDDLVKEREFERRLGSIARRERVHFKSEFSEHYSDWVEAINVRLTEILETFRRDEARLTMPYPPEMLVQIKNARREKIANKTRELERERHGIITKRAVHRKMQGPTAHVWATMTERERRMDQISRSVSEVGYVAQVKRALGFKFRDPNAWKAEMGRKEDKERLDKMLQKIRAENERRSSNTEESSKVDEPRNPSPGPERNQ